MASGKSTNYSEPPLAINGDAQKFDFREDDHDHYSQPGNLFSVQPGGKAALFENTPRALGPASKEVRDRHVANCAKADPAYGEGVAKPLEAFLAEHK